MKRIIWRGNRAHDLMSVRRAGRASFFASQHFNAHELTLKSCSRVLDLMQIRSDANRVSDRALRSIPAKRAISSIGDLRSRIEPTFSHRSRHCYITRERNISIRYLLSRRIFGAGIDCDSFVSHWRLRPRIVARGGDYRVRHPYKSTSLSSAFFRLPIFLSFWKII